MGLQSAVCLLCGRMGLDTLDFHLRMMHKVRAADYREKWGYNRRTSLTSPAFRDKRSELSGTRQSKDRMKKIRITPERAGKRHKLRPEAIQNRKLRGSLSAEQWEAKIPYWPIAGRCLKGEEKRHVAAALAMSPTFVNRRCHAMRLLPGRPVRYWRGEAVTDRHLLDLVRDFDLAELDVAKRVGLPVHRIRRAIARQGVPLQLDVADRVLQLRQLMEQHRGKPATPNGGAPHKLVPSEVKEIPWKYRVLRKELHSLREVLSDSRQLLKLEEIGELLCKLARQGKGQTLFFWAHEFLPWVGRECDLRAFAKELLRPHDIARRFLAAEYDASGRTIEDLLPQHDDNSSDRRDVRRRTLLLDLRQIFGQKQEVPTEEMISRLGQFRPDWKRLQPRELASLLLPAGFEPQNLRVNGRVVKGYSLRRLRIYSTEEAAGRLEIALITLKGWIARKKIPIPPFVRRIVETRGRAMVRVWTDMDLRKVRAVIARERPGVFRSKTSATFKVSSTECSG